MFSGKNINRSRRQHFIYMDFILIRKSMKLFNREMQCISFFKCMSLRRENLLIYSQPKPA